ncbi:MAPEG family protein [Hoeflea poritis]|uniref:MAPEG family protein n=1 Tax=Hoeflea poritis TaxID=2993659 RepID=A0ABT4VHF8_9HYPH|nr:MAPEG family protein [Hoeflea poritis]MDA4844127.1 MAPEG family protein [Hoeflea poritis]
MYVTPIFAGGLTLFYVYLAVRVITTRRTARVGLGDGGDTQMLRAIRVHANFAEYVPLGLLLMALAELQSAPPWIAAIIGLILAAGRLIHAYGVSRQPEVPGSRTLGMGLTFTALIIAAMLNLVLGLYQSL